MEWIMENKCKEFNFFQRIRNHQFQKLFFKNWLRVFLCIVLPLLVCVLVIQYFSQKSLLQEMDTAARRSVRNTKATLETLFDEVFDAMAKEVLDSSMLAFLQAERMSHKDYVFVMKVNAAKELVETDYRESLYHSVDAYSFVGDYLVSSLHKGQTYKWVKDQSLVSTFLEYMEKNSGQTLFAVSRIANGISNGKVRVITVYRTVSRDYQKSGFVSISVSEDKLIRHITDNVDWTQEIYLIVDDNNKVLLDTSGKLEDQILELPYGKNKVSTFSTEISGQQMRISWVDMEIFGWKCVQMVPMKEYQQSSIRLKKIVMLMVTFSVMIGILISYRTTVKLFRPIEAILHIIENPLEREGLGKQDTEIQYLLMRVLELFENNITLENEMIERLYALRRARAKALQEQMSPHFLNNVLQMINWLVVSETGNEDSATSQAIILLADIIGTCKGQTNNLTTVVEEVEYTCKFIELERLRYGSGIICNFNIDSAAENMLIPGISLQTLVENSIEHGFQLKDGSGTIYIDIHKNEQGGLYICIEDDGIGMDQENIHRIFKLLEQDYIFVGEHLGIVNLFQRFRLIYGENCGFDIKKSEYGGVCVEITTPKVSDDFYRT